MRHKLSFAEALNLAMVHEMESDPDVFAFGVDCSDFKRTFGSGKGLIERFGPERYFGSPVSEAGATGIAIGAALSGLRPVHIHARADFMLLTMNQLVNLASCKSYLSNGTVGVPLTVRAMIGRSWGQGPQHSKAMHSTYAHFPGLKVALPSNPQDAYSMLRTSIQDDNPTLFFEHRWLYDVVDDIDDELTVPLGQAKVVREGTDLTIIATSWMVVEALEAANILDKNGVSTEVVDVRTASPLDIDTIANSVSKTGYAIIADNDWSFCGLASEISAVLFENCFTSLMSPPVRVGFEHVPCPTTRPLETLFYPSAKDLIHAAEVMMCLPDIDLTNETFNQYENRFRGPF